MLKPTMHTVYFTTETRPYQRHHCIERPEELRNCIEITFTQVTFYGDDSAYGTVNDDYLPSFKFRWDGIRYVYMGSEQGYLYKTPDGRFSLIIPFEDDDA